MSDNSPTQRSLPFVSVIIPTWNRKDDVIACLNSLRPQRNVRLEIIVVDDGSTDGSVALVRALFPEVLVIAESQRYGLSYCRNLGILASQGEYILQLDSDTEMPDEYVISRQVRKFSEIPDLGSVGGEIALHSGDSSKAYGLCLGPKGYPIKVAADRDSGMVACDWVAGLNLMARRQLVFEVGGFDLNFEFGSDDTSFGFLIRAAGYRNYVGYDCAVNHKASPTGRRPDESYRYCLSGGRFLIKHHGIPSFLRYFGKYGLRVAAMYVWAPFHWLQCALKGRRPDRSRYRGGWNLIKAYSWDALHMHQIRRTRNRNFLDAVEMEKFAAWKKAGGGAS